MFVPATPAREHIRKLRAGPYYMSAERIATLAGLSVSGVSQILRGRRTPSRDSAPVEEIHRDTEAAILGVRPEVLPLSTGKLGAMVPSLGVRRRLQALLAIGFPMRALSVECGMISDGNTILRLVKGYTGKQSVYASTHRAVCEAYDRLVALGPDGYGLNPGYYSRSIRSAARNGYAPPGAWDADTIDDPEAEPEWTGACGTEAGYQIHYRERIPYCAPCRQAHHEYKLEHPGKSPLKSQRWAEIRRLSDDEGMSVEKIAKWLDVSERTVTRALKEERA